MHAKRLSLIVHCPLRTYRLRHVPCIYLNCDVSHAYLGILIDARLVLDVLGSVGIAQRADGLVVVVVSRAYVGNHHRLCVAAQGVLQSAVGLSILLSVVTGSAHRA